MSKGLPKQKSEGTVFVVMLASLSFWGGAPRPLGPVLGRSWSRLGRVGNHIEPSSGVRSILEIILGVEALLEPFEAILDALAARRSPRLDPGGRS